MGREYIWGENLFRDYLMKLTNTELDIVDEEVQKDISSTFSYVLEHFLKKSSDIKYLNFEIIRTQEYYKVIAHNMLTALWLTGIFIESNQEILTNNRLILENIEYVYNEKTKKLTTNQIK